MPASDDEKDYVTAALTVADVNAQLSGSGKEIAAVFKFKISWVREALTAVVFMPPWWGSCVFSENCALYI